MLVLIDFSSHQYLKGRELICSEIIIKNNGRAPTLGSYNSYGSIWTIGRLFFTHITHQLHTHTYIYIYMCTYTYVWLRHKWLRSNGCGFTCLLFTRMGSPKYTSKHGSLTELLETTETNLLTTYWLHADGSHPDTYTNTFIYIYKYTYYRDLYSCPLLLDTYHTVVALNSYNWLITSWNITLVAGVIIPFTTVKGHNCIYSIPIFRCKTCIHCVPHSVLVLGWSGWSSCSWCSGPPVGQRVFWY